MTLYLAVSKTTTFPASCLFGFASNATANLPLKVATLFEVPLNGVKSILATKTGLDGLDKSITSILFVLLLFTVNNFLETSSYALISAAPAPPITIEPISLKVAAFSLITNSGDPSLSESFSQLDNTIIAANSVILYFFISVFLIFIKNN